MAASGDVFHRVGRDERITLDRGELSGIGVESHHLKTFSQQTFSQRRSQQPDSDESNS